VAIDNWPLGQASVCAERRTPNAERRTPNAETVASVVAVVRATRRR
jgi:hypothetical protein